MPVFEVSMKNFQRNVSWNHIDRFSTPLALKLLSKALTTDKAKLRAIGGRKATGPEELDSRVAEGVSIFEQLTTV